MTHKPSASRALPCSMTWLTARWPAPRLIAIGLSSFSPQPTNGIHSSSRLSTQTCGGKITKCAIVSQAEVWLLMTMWLPGGNVFAALDREFRGRTADRSTQSVMRAQVRAIANWAR